MTIGPPTEALQSWLRENGGFLHPHLQLAYNSERGVHWQSTGTIEPGTTIISVPNSLSLSYLNGLVDDAFPVFDQRRDAFKIEAIGFFYLMTQWVHREFSFWKPYLDTLPSPEADFAQPLWFEDPADIEWLAGTDVWHTAVARRRIHEQYYQAGIAAFEDAGIDVAPYSWQLFKWAVTMYSSRSFTSLSLRPRDSKHWPTHRSLPDGSRQTVLLDMSHVPPEDLEFPVLFPAMDAPNHRHDAKVDWTFDPDCFSASIPDGADPGTEVWNNYGPKGNDELLLGYGFCITGNPHDKVKMTLKAPPPDLQHLIHAVSPDYFDSDGAWSSAKATFPLAATEAVSGTSSLATFAQLPQPLLSLMLAIIRHERSLRFSAIANPRDYLTSLSSSGRRYLPHIARMLVQSLSAKVTKLPSVNANPATHKQRQASIYLQSQHTIIASLIASMRAFTRSLLPSPTALTPSQAPQPRLLTLEALHALVFPSSSHPSPFLQGLAASAGTTDLTQLRLAGWEDDALVLLLSWLYLRGDGDGSSIAADAWPEYVPRPLQSEDEIGAAGDDGQAAAEALLPLIDAAAHECPGSLWCDEGWTPRLLVAVGGAVLRFDSFVVMCAVADGERADDGDVAEEPRLCVYLHA